MSSLTSVFVDSEGFALVSTGVWAFSHVQNTTFLASGRVWLLVAWVRRLRSSNLSDLRNHVILNGKDFIVEECTVILRDGFGGIIWLFVSDCG
jgi:hypothetical protein